MEGNENLTAPETDETPETAEENTDFALVDSGENGAEAEKQPENQNVENEEAALLRPLIAEEQRSVGVQRAFINRDVREFILRHPEMGSDGVVALEKNPQFRQFCGSRYGREPLWALYDDYRAVLGRAETAAMARQERRSARSTGSGGGNAAVLSPSQKASLDAWNAEHPEMKMTAKEFLVG